jgi:hypothetical protein
MLGNSGELKAKLEFIMGLFFLGFWRSVDECFTLPETLWLRLVPARRPPVDLMVEREVSCLVQVVSYRSRTRQERPIHI